MYVIDVNDPPPTISPSENAHRLTEVSMANTGLTTGRQCEVDEYYHVLYVVGPDGVVRWNVSSPTRPTFLDAALVARLLNFRPHGANQAISLAGTTLFSSCRW